MNILRSLEDSNFVVHASALGVARTCDSAEFLETGRPKLWVLPKPEQTLTQTNLWSAVPATAVGEELAFGLLFLAGSTAVVGGLIWALLA